MSSIKKVVPGCETCQTVGLYQNTVYCEACYRQTEQLPPVARKMKETLVLDIVKRAVAEFDPSVRCECGRKLTALNVVPDLLFNYFETTVIVEVDEFQHRSSRQSDNERTEKLKNHFKQLVIIRINPDTSRHRPFPMTTRVVKNIKEGGDHIEETKIVNFSGEILRRRVEIKNTLWITMSEILIGRVMDTPDRTFNEIHLFFD